MDASMEVLPVEILHRIFDSLDAPTILFSIRPVCRYFRSVVNSYDRYCFDFKLITKCNFHLICRLIAPQNLTSLTLYNNEQIPDQISPFILTIRLRQLNRLHSLNLSGIEELQLDMILKRINLNFLTSFSLQIQKYDDRRKKTTEHFLHLILAQSTLRKIQFDIKNDRISYIKWPLNCPINSLILHQDISYDNLCRMITSSSQLHSLVLKQSRLNMNNNIQCKSSFPQLTSLTIEELDLTLNQLESFLSSTPSLTYLKLVNNDCLFDGKRWEEFIQSNLPHLDQFEFFISSWKAHDQTQEDLELILQSFRSPFWIEYKKWYVAAEFYFRRSRSINIYSIPMCKSALQCELHLQKCFLSTSNDLSITDHINELTFSMRMFTNDNTVTKGNASFPSVTKLSLDFDRNISVNLTNTLPLMINFSQLIEVKIDSFYLNEDNKNGLYGLIHLLEQSTQLSSLIIHSRLCKYELYPFLNNLCSILPRRIKSLQMPIYQIEHIEMILKRCPHLYIVRFETTRRKLSTEVQEWFRQNTIDSMFRRHHECASIWIGKKVNQTSQGHKRMRLMENELKS